MTTISTETRGLLADRAAIVTGGTGALGRAVVRRLLAEGATVDVPFRSAQEAAVLTREAGADAGSGRLKLAEVDLGDDTSVERFFDGVARARGRLDLLANLAGGFRMGPIDAQPAALFAEMMAMNAMTAFLSCRAAAARMKAAGGGRIVNVAAMAAMGRGAADQTAYAASKAAVLNLTLSLADELAPRGVTVNAIVPTIIDTPANRSAMPDADTTAWLSPAEIAGVVSFLFGPDARIVTGAALTLAAPRARRER